MNMIQFRIKGIDYVDDSLQHGLGKGSGRGRPVGSKNGQVMPGAAYMKGYKIVGQKAEGDANLPGAQNTRSSSIRNKLGTTSMKTKLANKAVSRPTRTTASRQVTSSTPKQLSTTVSTAGGRQVTSSTPKQLSTPTENVAKGRQAVESLINRGSNQTAQTTQQTQNTRELVQPSNTQKEINDSPYSSRRIQEAGGLESRAGRQIVYDNPNLDQGFKKQVAKRYGDSDGKWYPQKMEQTAADQPEPKDNPWSERRINEAGGLESREGRQYVYDNPTLNEDYKKQLAKRYGDSDGRSYPKEMPAVKPQPETNSQNQASTQNTSEPSQGNMLEQVRNVANGVGNMVNDLGRQAGDFVNGIGQRLGNIFDGSGNQAPNPGSNSGETSPREAPVTNEATTSNATPTSNETPAPRETTQQSAPETPEQKSFWDNLGGWFEQAGKDIGNTAVGAWNTVSGAAGDAAKWVGDRFNDAGNWASTAYNDVKDWVGARGKEFGDWIDNAAVDVANAGIGVRDWLTGRDVTTYNNGQLTREHQPGVLENVGNALNDFGRGVADTATNAWNGATNLVNDAGRGVNEFWNGRDVEVNDNGRMRQGHEPGMGERIGNFFNDLGQGVVNTANDVSRGVGDFLNNAGQWVGDQAANVWEGPVTYNPNMNSRVVENADGSKTTVNYGGYERSGGLRDALNNGARALDTFFNGPRQGTPEAAPYYDLISERWIDPMSQSFGDRLGQWANNNIAVPAANTANAVGQWANDNVATPVSNAWNTASQWANENVAAPVSNAWNTASQWANDNFVTPAANTVNDLVRNGNTWWNGEDHSFFGIPTGHTPGFRENATQWANNNFVTPVSNAWNTASNAVTNVANNVGQTVGNAADATGLYAQAVAAGVPLSRANQLASQYASGQITPEEYKYWMDSAMNYARANR